MEGLFHYQTVYQGFLTMILTRKKIHKEIVEYGDYQTPVYFANAVCEKLVQFYNFNPKIILEPTMGEGSFIRSAVSVFSGLDKIFGIEINTDYYNYTRNLIKTLDYNNNLLDIYNNDIFTFDFNIIKSQINNTDNILILGNPPWVTNSQLSTIKSDNIPIKSNFKCHSGLDAMTGKGNFDIAEYIIIRLLHEFIGYNFTLAMLCKTTIAKNVIKDINKFKFTFSSADIFLFDANIVFGANCDACLFVIKSGKSIKNTCKVYDFKTNNFIREFGWLNSVFCSNIERHAQGGDIDGACQLVWRQGIKHDCSKVMELVHLGGSVYQNGLGEKYRLLQGNYVFPLVKSSDMKTPEITKTRKHVIVPQKRVNEETSIIKNYDIDIWNYLNEHENYLSARKSIIYKNAPKFSIFGIGDYSFSKFKVGISGFYKEPLFSLIWGEFPVMLDDTCYFLGFNDFSQALITSAILNSNKCNQFLKSIAFLDSKRPYTKEILQRIDLYKLSEVIDLDYLNEYIHNISSNIIITEADLLNYRDWLLKQNKSGQLSLFK
jgi:hypothetical protein